MAYINISKHLQLTIHNNTKQLYYNGYGVGYTNPICFHICNIVNKEILYKIYKDINRYNNGKKN